MTVMPSRWSQWCDANGGILVLAGAVLFVALMALLMRLLVGQ